MKTTRRVAAVVAAALAFAACGDDAESGTDATPSGSTGSTTSAAAGGSTTSSAPKALTGLDTTFGTAGVKTTPMSTSGHDRFMAVTTDNDGKVYAAGYVATGGDASMALARFTAAGELDKTFGTDGVATANVATGGKMAEVARAVVVQSSGKIVIAGPVEQNPGASGDAAKELDIAAVRFDTSGKLDASFGTGGIAKIDLGPGRAVNETTYLTDNVWGLGSLAGDKLALFGSKGAAGAGRTDTDYVLIGLDASGKLDASFGTGGTTVVDLDSSGDSPRNITIQKDGKIIATGYSRDGDNVVSPVIIRTSASGQLDTTFGKGGIATAPLLPAGVAESYAVGLQGDAFVFTGYGRGADANEKVDLISGRFTAAGTVDQTYGTSGVTRIDLAKDDDRGRNLVVLADGRILAVGSGKMTAANIDGLVVLLDKNGKPVSEFGTGGHVLSDLGGPSDSWFGVALSPDGKYAWIAGYKGVAADGGGNDDAVLARVAL